MKKMFLLFICLFICGCQKNDELVDKHIVLLNEKIEVYSDTYLYDLFNVFDIKLESKNNLINTKKLGLNSTIVEYVFDNHSYNYKIEYEVVDTTPPKYLGGTNKTILVNYAGDLCNLILHGDNYDKDVTCEIEGNYDLSKAGKYNVIYHYKDSSNNTTSANVTLNVVNKLSSSKPASNKKNNFSDILKKYKNDNTEVGIDISKWQGEIDFNKVKEDGATFVIMRIGAQGEAGGELYIDKYFKDNIKKAKEAGLKVGVYLYSIATTSTEAEEQAMWVINTLDGVKLDLPVVFDWENWHKWNEYSLSFYDINNICDVFLKTIEHYGYDGMLYSSKFYLENIWDTSMDYPVWLAHYTNETNYSGKYLIWQMSNTGRIDGINGDVDINVMYKEDSFE